MIVPLVEPDSLRPLLDLLISSRFGSEMFSTSADSVHVDERRAIDRAITGSLGPAVLNRLVDHRVLVGLAVVKQPGPGGELPPHQDWNMVDETKFSSLSCWFPISHVRAGSGRLCVLSGSHRIDSGLRGSPTYPSHLDRLHELVRIEGEELDVPLGHGVIHDNRLVHWSSDNGGNERRYAGILNAIPSAAEPRHWFFDESGGATEFAVPDEFYTQCRVGERPKARVVRTVDHYVAPEPNLKGWRRRRRRAPVGS